MQGGIKKGTWLPVGKLKDHGERWESDRVKLMGGDGTSVIMLSQATENTMIDKGTALARKALEES